MALNVDNKEGNEDSQDEMEVENNDLIEKNNNNNNNYGEKGDVICYGDNDDNYYKNKLTLNIACGELKGSLCV
jgi:hypothetical protein